jgi:hypothetical protein
MISLPFSRYIAVQPVATGRADKRNENGEQEKRGFVIVSVF